MKIALNTNDLRPATMAAMIADLVNYPIVYADTVTALIVQLEDTVGELESIDFLFDAGVTPEQLATVEATGSSNSS